MFTLTVQDERLYKRLMEKVEQRGESLDDVLRELLDQDDEIPQVEASEMVEEIQETPAQKLLRLIDAADLVFTNPFNGEDAEDILSNETGQAHWHDKEEHGST